MTLASGHDIQVTYTYDALNRLETVADANGATTYTYDSVGNRQSVTQANGVTTSYTYDSLNRLTKLESTTSSNTVLTRFRYTLDPTGRRTAIEELNGRTSRYTYDDLYRLVSETITDPVNGNYSASYAYDKVGNRTASLIGGVQTAYTYDDNDRLLQQGGTTYTYDANGNTLSETQGVQVTRYAYDARNRMVGSETASGASTYAYDINGIRTARTHNGVTTTYVVDHNQQYAQVLAEQRNGIAIKAYTYGDDLLSRSHNGESSFFLYDGLGSTRVLADTSGSVSDEYFYEAFGQLLQSTGSTDNSYRFTGEQYDSALQKYYLRARYYDQGVGRFTQMDEFSGLSLQPITLNKFLYASSDTVNTVDPSGYLSLGELNVAINNIGRSLSTAGRLLAKGAPRQGGKLLNRIGKESEEIVERIVNECIKPENLRKNPTIKGSKRQLDLLAEGENILLSVETKSKIPSYGSKALRRLKEQLIAAQKAGTANVKVVGVDKISDGHLTRSLGYLKRAGVDLSAVDFFNGAIEFARWSAEVYYEECIEE